MTIADAHLCRLALLEYDPPRKARRRIWWTLALACAARAPSPLFDGLWIAARTALAG